jgi:hypothetical protein
VLQLVNTPDIYEENKYQRRNLLLYHCLLESGLPKFKVSEQRRLTADTRVRWGCLTTS